MEIYLVGGAVRDKLLKYPYHEKDWVVVGSSPEAMFKLGYTPVGKDFPVFLHPKTKEEYALARLERKTGKGYGGFHFDTSPNVSLEDDLSRRDLTINAIAKKPCGTLVDPYGGYKDLQEKTLRHVSSAFSEDPVRILRTARFAARYHHLGFSIAPETMTLMCEMVSSGEVNHLVPERVWQEFEKALHEKSPHIFIRTLRQCHALNSLMPELEQLFTSAPTMDTANPPKPNNTATKASSNIDSGHHALTALEQAAALSCDGHVRFAALMHKLGHNAPQNMRTKTGLDQLKTLAKRLRLPNAYTDLAKHVIAHHPICHNAFTLKRTDIAALLEKTDAYRRPERFYQLLTSCKASQQALDGQTHNNYPQANFLAVALKLSLRVSTQNLLNKGLKGAELGLALKKERLTKIDSLCDLFIDGKCTMSKEL